MPRLAILEADILYDALRPVYDGYGYMCMELLRAAGLDWELDVFSVIRGEYPQAQADYQAFLITGSKYDSFADDDWIVRLRDYVQLLYAEGRPMVGICFGHQLLAHALGGRAGRSDAGWGLGIMQYHLREQPDFVGSDAGDTNSVSLIVSHQDQVHALPDEARLLLSNDFCPRAAFYVPGRLLALQGHPEFTNAYARDLLRCRADRLPAEVFQQALLSLTEHGGDSVHDGLKVAGWITRFLTTSVPA